MIEKISGIYKITSPTRKVYIGQSINCLHRKAAYKGLRCKKQGKLYQSILKHGWESHLFEIIHIIEAYNKEEIDKLEEYYGDLYNCYNPICGMNIKICGSSGRHSQESKDKISKGRTGHRHSVATKQKLSKDRMGIKRGEESRLKQSISLEKNWEERKNMGLNTHSEETKIRMSVAAKKRNESSDLRERISNSIKLIWDKKKQNGTDKWSDDTKKKNSESVKKSWITRKKKGSFSKEMKRGWDKLKSNPEYYSEAKRKERSDRAKSIHKNRRLKNAIVI